MYRGRALLVPNVFVSGADIAELLSRDADAALRAINIDLFDRLEGHRWPTIAAIDGWALGGGCELALACDFRVASETSVFGQPEADLGIIAGAGGNWRLAQLIGLGAARRMLLAGDRLDAQQATCSRAGGPGPAERPGARCQPRAGGADRPEGRGWRLS